ncbi:hypothetical protein RT41_GL001368 [Lactococcus fujiensis JCM 16395]|uniref:Uncharacterized protein n=1 Tax=Lactococcus fujiensis JCM 16395 TaxID=1291764 RepID=A0A2A5RMD3_9LACT|nr:hypothetical protein RT41_GL001368 [Lactococcus fujiensis JCM 16395]
MLLEKDEIALFTWIFAYEYENHVDKFDGCSIVKFSENKRCKVQEFQSKHEKSRPYLIENGGHNVKFI